MSTYYRSERCFRNYEPAIIAACAAYPRAISFTGTGRNSLTTDAARARDTITAWCDARWETDFTVTSAKMRDLTVWIEETKNGHAILIGPKALRRTRVATSRLQLKWRDSAISSIDDLPHVNVAETLKPANDPVPPLESLTLEEKISRLNTGQITGQITIPYTEEAYSEVTTLIADKLNVAFVVRDGNIILF